MDPPIHTEHFLSGGAMILIVIESGAKFLTSFWNSLVHRGTSRHHHISVQILPDIDITLHDGREGQFVDSLLFQSQKLWLEQCLRGSESFRSHSNHLTIG